MTATIFYMCICQNSSRKDTTNYLIGKMTTQMLEQILAAVSEVCEVNADVIRSKCKTDEAVYARCIFIHHCHKFSFPANTISKFLHRRQKCVVNKYVNYYDEYYKTKRAFRYLCGEVDKKDGRYLHTSWIESTRHEHHEWSTFVL